MNAPLTVHCEFPETIDGLVRMIRQRDDEIVRLTENKPCILVWSFGDSPYDHLSTNGGDEDWVAFVPSSYEFPDWVFSSSFGCSGTKEYTVFGGNVFIGAHA